MHYTQLFVFLKIHSCHKSLIQTAFVLQNNLLAEGHASIFSTQWFLLLVLSHFFSYGSMLQIGWLTVSFWVQDNISYYTVQQWRTHEVLSHAIQYILQKISRSVLVR